MSKWSEKHIAYAFLYLFVIAVFFYLKNANLLVDEQIHQAQIRRFFAGDYTLEPALTTVPGYHLLLAWLIWPFGELTLPMIRGVNMVFGLALIGVFTLLLRRIQGRVELARLVQFVFFPIILPFFFLAYTDVLGLALVLAGLYLALCGQWTASALVCLLSLTVRQNNVVWMAMIPMLCHLQAPGRVWDSQRLKTLARRCWAFILGGIGFAAFVVYNGGVAVGDRWAHPASGIHSGNFYFLLLIYSILFLPAIIANLRNTVDYIRNQSLAPIGLACLFLFYLFTFNNTHPYNHLLEHYFLRNWLLQLITSSAMMKIAFFLPMAIAFFDFLARAKGRHDRLLLGLFGVLAVLPSWLIEQRYYIVPLALLMLYRDEEAPQVEAVTSLYYVTAAVALLYGIATYRCFL
ncbi:Dol-P-Glc:Glc(2)Man(9)GlcNAc(2)-PP-Dol alpha-1,2-glucosyltransferase [Chitiniphilus purpureus]|uniref:Dol-P-Glc:Glc(2)Man(9)GlcNAc(2)-PP-Dol alpha-1,2-glucosyltransferase n=1 Tax=Chitiniphilus purpureus TaxID=2981137 RepID=A0ABY6DPB7_9NEIS|nr:Dol-P-Glc:Glc(2)Man(9)GlcNAc(2)-PP-Dol alpha-1,2-glucosyltransferase [Chitiniphilus sp. CD1]UXY16177.1 Dol-P-Glc:Glc(2)Man(9)GlcNAc(2)-PP-Dol alpha-1,2-glucosyltransferase [Chitiniphilus sp. CD1]